MTAPSAPTALPAVREARLALEEATHALQRIVRRPVPAGAEERVTEAMRNAVSDVNCHVRQLVAARNGHL